MLNLLNAPFVRIAQRFALVICLAAGADLSLAQELPWYAKVFGAVTVGSGSLATETRAAIDFQEIAVAGSMKVLLRQSDREGLEVTADGNLLPLIETRVSNGVLQIENKRGANYTTRNPVTVTVNFVALKVLSLGGSGSIASAGLKGSKLTVSLGGSGDVKLTDLQLSALQVSLGGSGSFAATGRSTKLNVSVGGSGGVLTERLDADDVSVSVAGSGDAVVRANRTLDVSVAGSGDVVYSGDAVARSSIAGSGKVLKR